MYLIWRKKWIIPLLLIAFLAGCATLDKEESHLFDQVNYSEQISKREVTSEDDLNSPKKRARTVTVMRDSTFSINYLTIITRKKDGQGLYHLMENSVDTIQLSRTGDSFLTSENTINGTFVRPKTDFPIMERSRKIIFNSNGSCIETRARSGGDSPQNSSLHESKGEYRMINDTLNVTYYLGRTYVFGDRYNKGIEDIQWHVTQPISYQYLLNADSDSLFVVNKNTSKSELYLVAGDTVQVLPNKHD